MLGSTNITIPVAFVAGLASFLSPCVLPLVPGYISMISGISLDHLKGHHGAESRKTAWRAVVFNSLAFNAGLSMIFVALGAAAGLVGAAVLSNPYLRIGGGLIIIAFGLQLIGVLKIGALYRDTRKFADASRFVPNAEDWVMSRVNKEQTEQPAAQQAVTTTNNASLLNAKLA